MSHNIFISYSEGDVFMMRRLRYDFGQAQFFVSTSDDEQGILQADGVVVLLSPESAHSVRVQTELQTARTMRKPVFPVLVSGEAADVARLQFRPHQWIDLRFLGDYEQNLSQLMIRVAHELDIPQEILPTIHAATMGREHIRAEALAREQAIADAKAYIANPIPNTTPSVQDNRSEPGALPLWLWIVAGAAIIIVTLVLVILLN